MNLLPPGSENDPNYHAEVIKNADGTFTLRPAPAFRKPVDAQGPVELEAVTE